ncbi:hypothetical protein C5167_041298 [Papaver somniferum]|uniref:AMP-dependent synthetase/ligase domain-containing protein n=1 Tax=Papaver somniferum TaxID=3469 RepID=A0A4Y7IHH7_PAPSO|nr:hypothetical protein C5167_041298 [Papaver somniferum]
MFFGMNTLTSCLSRISTARNDRVFTVFGDPRKTGLEFVQSVCELANGLSELGIQKGDVVAIAALNRFKIPKVFLFWRKPFPLTSTGKPRRREVRQEAISKLQLTLPSYL